MSRGVGGGGESGRPPTRRPATPAKTGLDPTVAWSVTLHVLFFPWLIAVLIGLALAVSALDVELGGSTAVGTQRLLVAGFVLIALLPLAASAIIGIVGWRRRRRRGALVAGSMSIVVAVLVVLTSGALLLQGGAG